MNGLSVVVGGEGFRDYLRKVNNIKSLTQEEEFMLAKDYLENHNLDAAHKLVMTHLKLVAKIAMQYRGYGLPVADLVSEGNMGLMHAVKKYNPDLGYRLSTYAMWWIKASIQEYVLKSWSLVKIGTTSAQKKLFFSLNKIKNKISNMYSRPVNSTDYKMIAHELGVTEKEVKEMNQRLVCGDTSLNLPASKNEDVKIEKIDIIKDNSSSQEELVAIEQEMLNKKTVLSNAMKLLTDREERILTARKLESSPLTLDKLSNEYNVSKERIRQIENRAFEKIKGYILKHINNNGEIFCNS